MKKSITLFLALLVVSIGFTQNEFINYKAVVKDGNGDIITNDLVVMQFEVREGSSTGSAVYQELHTLTTDASGLVILNIGEGTPLSGVFNDIEWASDTHFLNVQINTGAGLVDMGTTEFQAVPYALNAANVSGLEALDEGNGIGWRLIGADPANHGNIGKDAVDFSYQIVSSEISGATGDNSTALGFSTSASNFNSFAAGYGTYAVGAQSTSLGNLTYASGEASMTTGSFTKAESHSSTAIGAFNVGGGDPTTFPPLGTSPLFEIGNGTNGSALSNAMTVLYNGTITAPSFTNALIDAAGDKALVTKEYTMNSISESAALKKVDQGANPPGWRLDDEALGGYLGGPILSAGIWSVDMSLHETFLNSDGSNSQATGVSGNFSFSHGLDNAVLGDYSASFGIYNALEGNTSSVFGNDNWAFGDFSTVHGKSNRTTGNHITAFGTGLKADAFHSLVIGRYNVGGGSTSTWVESDPILEIGVGTSDGNRSNAVTILKSGKVTVNESTPSFDFNAINGIKTHTGNTDASGIYGENTVTDFYGYGVSGLGGYMGVIGEVQPSGSGLYRGVYGSVSGTSTGTNYGVYGFAAGGTTNYAVFASGDLAYTGALVDASDSKLKTNVNTIGSVLGAIGQLNPSSYIMKEGYQKSMNMSDKPEYGFIAQELQEVFPDLISRNVHPGETKEAEPIEYLGVNYMGLIPILTKGMQEQQAQIESQQILIEQQQEAIDLLKKRLDALEN